MRSAASPSTSTYGEASGSFSNADSNACRALQILALLEEDPGVAADELLSWLGDATPLNSGEATVWDVAARLLWLTRDREPDLRLGMLANGSRPDVTERLIGRIARDPPEVAAQVAAGWLETPEPDRERPALLILNQVDHRSLTDTTRDAALDGLETLVRRGDAFARSQALGLLMRVPDRRAAHLDGLLHGLLESDAELRMWLLGPALGHADLAERSAVLTAAGQLTETAEGDRLDDLLFYLSVHLMTSDVDAVLSVLARVLDRGPELRSRGAHLASQLLWKATAVPSEQESTLLRVMAQGPDARRALIVPLTSAGALADRPEQRERLLYRLVELSGDDEMMGDVAELLRSDLEPLPFDILRAVTSRLAPADLDWAVVSGSMPTGSGSADRCWDQVSAWIDVIGDAELGPGLRAMVAARRSGADRHDCWRAAMEALRASLGDG